jgi:hypothetical protein
MACAHPQILSALRLNCCACMIRPGKYMVRPGNWHVCPWASIHFDPACRMRMALYNMGHAARMGRQCCVLSVFVICHELSRLLTAQYGAQRHRQSRLHHEPAEQPGHALADVAVPPKLHQVRVGMLCVSLSCVVHVHLLSAGAQHVNLACLHNYRRHVATLPCRAASCKPSSTPTLVDLAAQLAGHVS